MGGCAKSMLHPYDNFDITFLELASLICNIGNAEVQADEK